MTLRQFTQAIAGVLCTAGLLAGAEPPGTESPESLLISRGWYEHTAPERTAEYVFGSCLGLPNLGQLWLEHPAAEHERLAGRNAVCVCGRTIPEARTYRVWVFESCQLRTAWTSYAAAIQKESIDRNRIFSYWGGFTN